MHTLAQVYTTIPLLCLIGGWLGRIFYCHQRAKWLDKYHPSEAPHRVESFNRVVAVVAGTLFLLGYILVKMQGMQDGAEATNQRTEAQEARLKVCVVEFQRALTERSNISAQDFKLSKEIDDLRSENDKALAKFLDDRFNPPTNIAVLDTLDPRRLQWRDDITRAFADQQRATNAKIAAKQTERNNLSTWRDNNPLPALKC